MKRAIIYVRVSTDEQSEKGYSLQHQEDRLRLYCQHQNIEIVGFYKEDHSAKTFERPAFNELLAFLKKNRNAADLLLFLKWDRFSRNAGDAYFMINKLNRMGVEPQAIEQPLDLNIPENKIMLAFYLAAPEVENDRRSLNTIAGMRRAMKDGRYVTVAPKGYKNIRNELNKPIIVPCKDAPLVKWVFEEVAKGILTVKDVWRMAKRKGLNVGRSNIWYLLRNPIYCGKIFLPAYKDEKAMLVRGLHEPIISEELFYEVQDVLDGRKRKAVSKYTAKEELPLRGFLKCPRCGRNLTGSAAKGNGGIYFYYHCQLGCKERQKAEKANDRFVKRLGCAITKEKYITLFEKVAEHTYRQNSRHQSNTADAIQAEINKHRLRIANAQQLMLDGELSAADYREIKSRYEQEIEQLERKKKGVSQVDDNLVEYASATAELLRNLPTYYKKATLPVKQKLVGSICSGKLVFNENDYQTMEFNDIIQGICKLGEHFDGLEKGQASDFGSLSEEVIPLGLEPTLHRFPTSVKMKI
jgi:DNA invertase Pin-like site-specific DNA recombinase